MKLFTIGYSGKTEEEFLALLSKHNITQLIDVRRRASSRNKAFNKTNLKTICAENNIKYTHNPDLGPPQELRDMFSSKNNWSDFRFEFVDYITRPWSVGNRELKKLIMNIISKEDWTIDWGKAICLMCMEESPEECHRSLITETLKVIADQPEGNSGLTEFEVIHIR